MSYNQIKITADTKQTRQQGGIEFDTMRKSGGQEKNQELDLDTICVYESP